MSGNKVISNVETNKPSEEKSRDEYVLRRGVIISDRNLFNTNQFTFGHNDIIIPVATLEAIREYKGKGMKMIIGSRAIEYLSSIEDLAFTEKGYPRGNGSYIKIVDCNGISEEIKKIYGLSTYDQRVLQICLDRIKLKKDSGDEGQVILISSNIIIRRHAKKLGIIAKAYEDKMYPEPDKQYRGMITVEADYPYVEAIINGNQIKVESVTNYTMYKWYNNMFVTLKSPENCSALGIYNYGKIYPVNDIGDISISKVTAKNKEQKFFVHAFKKTPEECSVIIAKGAAGVGKTFLALAGALSKLDSKMIQKETLNIQDNSKNKKSTNHSNKKSTNNVNNSENVDGCENEISKLKIGVENGDFDKIILTTPMVTISNESLGALPGDKDEKTAPYYGGVMDNLSKIITRLNPELTNHEVENVINHLFATRIIEIIPIAFMRGRSFTRKCVILDEAQNVEPDDVLDIVSRLGEGSRLVICGDPQQVNKVGLNKKCNGIVYATEGLKEFSGCYVITFSDSKIQRSSLAKYAVQHLL